MSLAAVAPKSPGRISEWQTALEIGKSKQAEALRTNPILEVIDAFESDKRVLIFDEDFRVAIKATLSGTLIDSFKLSEAADRVKLLAQHYLNLEAELREKSDEIILDRQKAGVTKEDGFIIEPVTKKTNRTPDINRIREDTSDLWDLLLQKKIAKVKEEYKPTQAELSDKEIFGEYFEQFLIPGSVEITGYTIEPVSPESELPPVEVEP